MKRPLAGFRAAAACVLTLAHGALGAGLDLSRLPPPAAREIDFIRDIRPIFETACIRCHGSKNQKGQFRLDEKAAALKGGESYAPAIIPGKSAESPLMHFVAGLDPDMLMPSKGERLTVGQMGLLRAWIDQGALWPDDTSTPAKTTFWAFKPVMRPAIPEIRHSQSAICNPIDVFVCAKLAEANLQLSSEASSRTFIRRLYFDVIGLPPAPQEVDAFLESVLRHPPDAINEVIEKLLASPHYGERWARHWLDVVRFAETAGFETNQPRPNAWPYRDYVIHAFNDDKPYDEFIREQIAGDLLGVDEATGFLVGGPNDLVKSPDVVLTVNQRADELHDMIATTGSAFLGLTVGCARCHNHKFDPIPQTDYYAIKAVLEGVQHGERPVKDAVDPKHLKRAGTLRSELEVVINALANFEPMAHLEPMPREPLRMPVTYGRNVERIAPIAAKFIRFTILEASQLEPCIDELEVFTAEPMPHNIALARNGTKVTASGTYTDNSFHKLEYINDGIYGNERSWISNERGRGWVQLELPNAETIGHIVWSRDRAEVPRYNDRLVTRYKIETSMDGRKWQVVASSDDRFAPGTKVSESAVYSTEDKPNGEAQLVNLLEKRRALEVELAAAVAKQPVVYAGRMEKPQATFRFHRGDPMQPREAVAPGALSALPVSFALKDADSEPERRFALANWIVDPKNPLTARVMVNRIWQHHFGEGLVSTPSDFGANGGRPSHPELLDWLASEFISHGWSIKHLHRLILRSATYRQSSAPRSDGLATDAGTRLLWRFPPNRLEAEPIRDAILAISGKLDFTAGGEGFSTFEPNDDYVRVYNPKLRFAPADWRRMIYMTKIRMQQDATFGVFDCPDGGQTAPLRTQSTTPLQTLNLLNSPFVLQQAAFFAERLVRECGNDPVSQIKRAFCLAFCREACTEEIEAAKKLILENGLPIFCRAIFNSNEFIHLF